MAILRYAQDRLCWPARGPETWCVTTVGCLSLMGMNAEGVTVGTTNLRTRDAGPGVPYLGLIHAALEASSAADAVRTIAGAPRAGGHAYSVVDRFGEAFAVECTARRSKTFALRGGFHVHTNHCQVPEHQALEAELSFASSQARLARMQELLRDAERIDPAFLERALADGANGRLAICRDDFEGISTNAALVASPEGREFSLKYPEAGKAEKTAEDHKRYDHGFAGHAYRMEGIRQCTGSSLVQRVSGGIRS